jgi:ubiquinone/menaquinone biosynthesis C-methylase UbiE
MSTELYDVIYYYDHMGKRGLVESEPIYGTGDDPDIALSLLSPGDKVLDLGCGHGRVSVPLAKRGYEVFGIDVSPEMINSAQNDAKDLPDLKLNYTVGNIKMLPYESEFFDKAICFWSSFSHLLTVEEQAECINEIFRVLKSDGYAFIVMPDPEEEYWQIRLAKSNSRIMVWERQVPWHDGPLRMNLFIHDEQTINQALAKTKFEKFEIERYPMNGKTRLVLHLHKAKQ